MSALREIWGKKLRRIKTINEIHEETLRDKGTFNGVG